MHPVRTLRIRDHARGAAVAVSLLLAGVGAIGAAQVPAPARIPNPTAATAQAGAQIPAPAEIAPPLQVVIAGRYRGPKLWRVSRGDHVLWVLGTVAPLPKRMIWQTEDIQRLLGHTQEVIPAWPSVGIGFHPFTALHLYALWREAQGNPDHQTLRAVLPADLYARFSALQARFAPRDRRLEALRPILAAKRLYDEALSASDLTPRDDIQRTVLALARQAGVTVHQDKLRVSDPVAVMRDLTKMPRAAEIACLRSVVTRLETDLGPMQARARAWALGDVALLRRLPHTDNRDICLEAVSGSQRVRTLLAQAQQDWMRSAVQALARNRTTLALQSMDRLLGPGGTLQSLRSMGYTVEGP